MRIHENHAIMKRKNRFGPKVVPRTAFSCQKCPPLPIVLHTHSRVRITLWDCSKIVLGWLYHKLKSKSNVQRQIDRWTYVPTGSCFVHGCGSMYTLHHVTRYCTFLNSARPIYFGPEISISSLCYVICLVRFYHGIEIKMERYLYCMANAWVEISYCKISAVSCLIDKGWSLP